VAVQAQERTKVVCLGDSTTAGTPGFLSPIEAPPDGEGNPESAYPYWVAKAHPEWMVLNRGVNGERSDQILNRFDRDVVSESPRVVVVLAGVNDVYQGFPAEFTEKNLDAMYEGAVSSKATPIGCSILPYNTIDERSFTKMTGINEWVKSTCQERGFPFCDTSMAASDPMRRDRLSGTPDGLHPDVAGYRMMGEQVTLTIERLLRFGR